MKKLLVLLIALMALTSCSKEEGYGGLASISGKVYAKDYNSSGTLVSEGYLAGMKVYISSHDGNSFYDDVDTYPDGSFKFDFLHKGTYDVWVIGDCDYCPWDQVYVLKTIEVTSKKEDVVVEDFVISI
ncbi:hypothetical protein [Flavobacterium suncheonense]|uniref:Lipoprotein n=1 Tax=Flavobacterium suncheonense GH29-5 = DSM 17707 TaxID=1121899 RepID=A0A0A2MEZ8_9FLAO|nr:hypothetical protein [Flavobacterium suncheonense]KGO90023.1 hypothetical protein Q764_05285 [Flavobacterium suncheonense GH29-5 = DSM 17707]